MFSVAFTRNAAPTLTERRTRRLYFNRPLSGRVAISRDSLNVVINRPLLSEERRFFVVCTAPSSVSATTANALIVTIARSGFEG